MCTINARDYFVYAVQKCILLIYHQFTRRCMFIL
jgi:hypothetical protein